MELRGLWIQQNKSCRSEVAMMIEVVKYL